MLQGFPRVSEIFSGKRLHSEDGSYEPAGKNRLVHVHTVEKWKRENDKDLSTLTWLRYDTSPDKKSATRLFCTVCIQFKEKVQSRRNFSGAFIDGTTNMRASAFKDHAASDMDARWMNLLKQSQSTNPADYAPIARALHRLDAAAEAKVKRKFEIAYYIAKKISFSENGRSRLRIGGEARC